MKLIIPLILIGISVAVFFGYVDPTYGTIKQLRTQESDYDQALTKSKELQDTRDRLLSRYNTFSSTELDRLTKLLPDTVDNVRLVLDLDSIASRYGMRTRDVVVKNEAPATPAGVLGPDTTPYGVVLLSFSVTGTYDNFTTFMHDLEQSLRLVDVESLSFSAKDAGTYDFTVGVRTYWLK